MQKSAVRTANRVVEVAPPPDDSVIGPRHDPPHPPDASRPIGAGRSAVVYRVRRGRDVWARKIFEGEALAKLVHVILTGAPNPYTWNQDAIAAAVGRRRLLDTLVRFWFDDGRLRLPALRDSGWNAEARAYQIDMEFIDGRGAALRHHAPTGRETEMRELVAEIMGPLQRHLREAGFDGLVWQAGFGNPVASSNFLLDRAEASERRWVWIDLESGVPALFPLNVLTLVSFYLPKSVRHRGPLFDDVDAEKLRGYLRSRQTELDARLGTGETERLIDETDALAAAQERWKTLGRLRSSVGYAERRGHITPEEAEHYETRALRWYARLARRGARQLPSRIAQGVRKIWRKLIPHSLADTCRAGAKFLFSQQWRSRWAAHLIRVRIRKWKTRRQLAPEEAQRLIAHVRTEEATAYYTDFAMHIAIKAPIKIIEWFGLPALFAAGVINQTVLLVGLATGGMIGRTLYTLWRMVQATARGRERPWVALVVGLLPVVGNAAYPMQILYTSADRDHDVAKFILIDLFTAMGRKIPIWGGPDTRTEHTFNRVPAWFLARLRPRRVTDSPDRG